MRSLPLALGDGTAWVVQRMKPCQGTAFRIMRIEHARIAYSRGYTDCILLVPTHRSIGALLCTRIAYSAHIRMTQAAPN